MPAQRPGRRLCPSFPNGPAWPRASLVPTRPVSGCKGAGLPADARLPHLSPHRSCSKSHQALPRSPGKGVSGAHVQEGLSDSGKIYGSTDAPETAAAPREALPGWVQQEKLVMLWLCPWHTTPHASRRARRFSLSLGRGKAFAAAGPHPHPPGPEGRAQSRGAATLAPEAPTVRSGTAPAPAALAPRSCPRSLGLCPASLFAGASERAGFPSHCPTPLPAFPRLASFSRLIVPGFSRFISSPFCSPSWLQHQRKAFPCPSFPPPSTPTPLSGRAW